MMDEEILRRLEETNRRLEEVEKRITASSSSPAEKELFPKASESSAETSSVFAPLSSLLNQEKKSAPKTASPATSTVFAGAQGVSSVERKNLELYIGRWILGFLGVIAIILGTSFFLKYAFENNLIGPVGRVLLGVAGGFYLSSRERFFVHATKIIHIF